MRKRLNHECFTHHRFRLLAPVLRASPDHDYLIRMNLHKTETMTMCGYSTTLPFSMPEKSLTPGVGLMGIWVHALNGNEFHWILPWLK
jgi:hypothetical protein